MSVVYSTDGRVIGTIEGSTFYKRLSAKIHRLRKPPAWATDADSFDKEVAPNCQTFTITDTDSGKRVTVSVKLFIAHRFVFNRKFGRQYALPLKWWTEDIPSRQKAFAL